MSVLTYADRTADVTTLPVQETAYEVVMDSNVFPPARVLSEAAHD